MGERKGGYTRYTRSLHIEWEVRGGEEGGERGGVGQREGKTGEEEWRIGEEEEVEKKRKVEMRSARRGRKRKEGMWRSRRRVRKIKKSRRGGGVERE